mgnify:CR=1 FL=1
MKDIALHILDVANNSISAKATLVEIVVNEQPDTNTFTLSIIDNGKGMSSEILEQVTDPFYTTRTTRKVGLGIPLLKQNAEQSGGKLSLESEPGKGTKLEAVFQYNKIGRAHV